MCNEPTVAKSILNICKGNNKNKHADKNEIKVMMIFYRLMSMMTLLTFYIAISMALFFMFVYLHFFMIITMRSNTYYVYSVYKSSIFLLLFTDRLPPISTSFNTILKTNMKYVLQAQSIRSTPARTHIS